MGIEDLRKELKVLHRVLVDTMVFSYHISNHPRYAPLTQAIMEMIEAGDIEGVTTTITLAELLTVPARANNQQAMHEYEIYLSGFPHLLIFPLDVTIARETAIVRAATGLRTPDAVQVATARVARVQAIVTNDRRWLGKIETPRIIILDDYVE